MLTHATGQDEGAAQAPHSREPRFALIRSEESFPWIDEHPRPWPWAALKRIPLGGDPEAHLSFGGELRWQYERYENQDWGAGPQDGDGYLLQRYTLHADARLGRGWRAFAQLYAAPVLDLDVPPAPPDENELTFQQAFLEHAPMRELTFRLGRQEIALGSQRLVGVREGPNVRRSFEGVRGTWSTDEVRADAFLFRPMSTRPGVFDDSPDRQATFWGLYATVPMQDELGLDLYYLGLERDGATYDQGTGDEMRHSIGARVFGKAGALDVNFEGVFQFGSFAGDPIRAWTFASDTGWEFADVPGEPRLGLKANVVSGDEDPDRGTLGTFQALYPRGNYFGESALIGPANLWNVHPHARWSPLEDVEIEVGWDFYWRQSTKDGIYGNGGQLLRPGGANRRSEIGDELSLVVTWSPNPFTEIALAYARFEPGAYLRGTSVGERVDFVSLKVQVRF